MKVKETTKTFYPVTIEITFETREEIKKLYERLKDGTIDSIVLSHMLGELLK